MKNTLIERLQNIDFNNPFATVAESGDVFSYQEFFGRCSELSVLLSKNTDKQHVVLIMENSVELMACYFAVMMTCKIATAIDPQKGKNEIDDIVKTIDDAFIVTDNVGIKNIDCYDLLLKKGSFKQIKEQSAIKDSLLSIISNLDFEKDYLLTFTSGTSGNTKGVRHSLNNLLLAAEAFNKEFNVDYKNVFAHYMPMTYMAGILNSIFQPFVSCAQVVIMGRFSPLKAISFWQQVEKFNVNTFWLSPSMLTLILKMGKHELGKAYCERVNPLFFIGTAPLHMSTRTEFETKYNATLYASYGLSETLFLSTETPATLSLGGGNVGKILESVQYRFGEDGEFLVDVPWMFLGYTNEHTDKYFDGSSYKTGDLAKIENKILSIVGRSKDLIIKGGMNISPALIESFVTSLNGVEECVVFGVLNRFKEELVVLAYTTNNNARDDIEKVISSEVLKHLGKNYLIDAFYRTKSIPKNINGKNDKKTIKDQYLKEHVGKI